MTRTYTIADALTAEQVAAWSHEQVVEQLRWRQSVIAGPTEHEPNFPVGMTDAEKDAIIEDIRILIDANMKF